MVDNEDGDLEHEERRHSDRSRLIVDVFFDGKAATGVASTKDISTGGFYMNTHAAIPEGSILAVRIPFSETSEVISNAEVVYCNAGLGVGVRFRELTSQARETLERELKHE